VFVILEHRSLKNHVPDSLSSKRGRHLLLLQAFGGDPFSRFDEDAICCSDWTVDFGVVQQLPTALVLMTRSGQTIVDDKLLWFAPPQA
jgi:hypothetical protein